MQVARDGIDKFFFVGIPSHGFIDEQLRSFSSSLEANISLTTKEWFVPPAFGDLHVLMDAFFARYEVFARTIVVR